MTCHCERDTSEQRRSTRRARLKYIIAHAETIWFGGAIISDGGTMIGRMTALDVASRWEAEAFARKEPYSRAGMFARIDVSASGRECPSPGSSFCGASSKRKSSKRPTAAPDIVVALRFMDAPQAGKEHNPDAGGKVLIRGD